MRAVAEAEKVRCEIGYTALTSLQRVRSTHCTLVAVLQLASALRFSLRGDRDFGRPWCCFIRVLRGREILFGGGCSSRRRDVVSRLGITSPCRGECCLVLTHTRWTCPSSAASALSYSSLEWIAGGGSVWSIGGFFSHPSSYRIFFAASVLQTLVAVASCCFPAFSLTDLVSLPDLEAASCEVMARLLGASSPSMKACSAHVFATTHRFFDKGTHDVCVWLRRVGAAFRYSTVVTFGDGCC